ncbi:MAG: CPBP family intramembrane metalloprotease [Oscillospiraceae bacterium]|nr:CPBP family intramembrane metalloprotease [Oscillospiraceae bacterium]
MSEYVNKTKILLWVSVVYVLSFICYVPTLLERYGIVFANGLLFLKYFFVCIPALTSAVLLLCECNLKSYLARMFSGKIAVKHFLTFVIFTLAGITTYCCYSIITGANVFQNAYSSVTSLLTGCIYLFITAFAEETAWRGFLLERVPFKEKSSVIFVGVIWAVWHMPMWIIRNLLGTWEIICLCIWTVLVSVVLGMTYYQCRNILLIAMLHAAFNLF